MEQPIARLYRDAQTSFVDLVRSLDANDWATSVPCTPNWTVRDVLSHVAGVTDDIANNRVDGAATDAWTQAQVDRWRDADASVLIDQWSGQIGEVATLLEAVGEIRPPSDCHTHEHDIRHALGRFDNQSSEIMGWLTERFQTVPCGRPVAITFDDGTTGFVAGDGDPIELSGLSQFEFVRSRFGRRSRDQVAGYNWSDTPGDELLTNWFAFGPSELPIVEAASKWG